MKWRILRLAFVLIMAWIGYTLAYHLHQSEEVQVAFALWGLAGATLTVILEYLLEKMSLKGMAVAGLGLFVGLSMAFLMANVIQMVFFHVGDLKDNMQLQLLVKVLSIFLLGYLGIQAFRSKQDEFFLLNPSLLFKGVERNISIKVLDSSVIIDGRIGDMAKVGFLEGIIVVPQFILKELHAVADSQDSLKRNRGRRGLDVLNELQKDGQVEVKIHDQDYPDLTDMDSKLVKLSSVLGARLLTIDIGLSKLAALQGVQVLNIHELSNALKPVVLPGEVIHIQIMKEGKEPGQGVGYLEDGTMVVVEDARHRVKEPLQVVISSVLQTTAGRMIFGKIVEEPSKRPRKGSSL